MVKKLMQDKSKLKDIYSNKFHEIEKQLNDWRFVVALEQLHASTEGGRDYTEYSSS